ncbi:hypothetical protein, partial [Klebsiella pneumoniae]|uniref:hypothetical protein n=1 Tax=Klebsiella pneumoniae TaxID=573 RepID=UPI002553CAD6
GKLTVGKSQLLAHPVTHSGFRLQHDDLTSRTYSHLPSVLTVGDQLLWGAAEPLRRMLNILLGKI